MAATSKAASKTRARTRRPAQRQASRTPRDQALPPGAMPTPAEVEELGRKADELAENRDESKLKYLTL